MTSEGKVRVVVKSRKVPTGIVELVTPEFVPSGFLVGMRSRSGVIYDFVLDSEQTKAIEEGYKLSCSLGLELEIVDRSKLGIFRRILPSLRRVKSRAPTLVIAPPMREDGMAQKISTAPV
jgi:hypothetical protein